MENSNSQHSGPNLRRFSKRDKFSKKISFSELPLGLNNKSPSKNPKDVKIVDFTHIKALVQRNIISGVLCDADYKLGVIEIKLICPFHYRINNHNRKNYHKIQVFCLPIIKGYSISILHHSGKKFCNRFYLTF